MYRKRPLLARYWAWADLVACGFIPDHRGSADWLIAQWRHWEEHEREGR